MLYIHSTGSDTWLHCNRTTLRLNCCLRVEGIAMSLGRAASKLPPQSLSLVLSASEHSYPAIEQAWRPPSAVIHGMIKLRPMARCLDSGSTQFGNMSGVEASICDLAGPNHEG